MEEIKREVFHLTKQLRQCAVDEKFLFISCLRKIKEEGYQFTTTKEIIDYLEKENFI